MDQAVVTAAAPAGLGAAQSAGGLVAGQIARFGELAGRDLAARAITALRAGEASAPQARPLTAGEHQEMLALRATITGGRQRVVPAATAGTGPSGPLPHPRLPLLRHPPAPGPRPLAGRHHRTVPDRA